MKKLFEQYQERMTPAEDRRVWSAMRDEVTGAHRPRRSWRLPALASTAAVAVLAVVLVRTGTLEQGLEQEFARELGNRTPVSEVEPRITVPEPAEDGSSSAVGGKVDEVEIALKTTGELGDAVARQDKKEGDDLRSSLDLDDANRPTPVRSGTVSAEEKVSAIDAAAAAAAAEGHAAGGKDEALFEVNDRTNFQHNRTEIQQRESQSMAKARVPDEESRGAGSASTPAESEQTAALQTLNQVPASKPQLRERLTEDAPVSLPADDRAYRTFGGNDIGGTDPVNGQAYGAMFFKDYGTNPFLDPRDDRFATFAVDVDKASYAMARAYLQRGQVPPAEAVRVEEFVNAFDHGYPAPFGDLTVSREAVPSEHGTFAIYVDAAPSPFGKDMHLMRVGLKGREIDPGLRKPAVLTFVIDTSGSMSQGNRLELVKQSLRMMLDGLRPEDRVAVVAYGNQAVVHLSPTSASDRGVIEGVLSQLRPNGGTNAEAGLRTGYDLAGRFFTEGCINRVILCSDGVANIGVTGADGIGAMLKNQSERGIELTAIGVGLGNYNDVLLEQLADSGDGNYYYVDTIDEARDVFVNNLTGTLQTIASDVKIQVEFKPGTVRKYRLLGYENRDIADRDFRNDTVDAGEVGAGHEVTALFEVHFEDNAKDKDRFATVRVRYADPATGRVTEEARGMVVDEVQDTLRSTDPTFRLDAAVAEFAEILRESYWARESSLSHALGLARSASWDMGQPAQARELVQLLETAMQLKTWPPAGYDPERDENR